MRFLGFLLFVFATNSYAVLNGVDHDGKSFERDCVLTTGKSTCQCTVLEDDIGITAAHCFDSIPRGSRVKVTLKATGEEEFFKFWMVHPQWHRVEGLGNDIAVFRLNNPLSSEAKMEKIYLPKSNPPRGMSGRMITGAHTKKKDLSWSYAEGRKSYSVEIESPFRKSSLGDLLIYDSLKVHGTDPESNICYGDSGAGVTMNVNGKEYLVGVVSELDIDRLDYLVATYSGTNVGSPCNYNKNATAYLSSTAYHRDWIEESIKILKLGDDPNYLGFVSLIQAFATQTSPLREYVIMQNTFIITEDEFKQLNSGFPEGSKPPNSVRSAE